MHFTLCIKNIAYILIKIMMIHYLRLHHKLYSILKIIWPFFSLILIFHVPMTLIVFFIDSILKLKELQFLFHFLKVFLLSYLLFPKVFVMIPLQLRAFKLMLGFLKLLKHFFSLPLIFFFPFFFLPHLLLLRLFYSMT